MTGQISGEALGEKAIPERWLKRSRETVYTLEKIRQLALELYRKGRAKNFKIG